MMDIRQIKLERQTDDSDLDEFVGRNLNGTPFHTSAWKKAVERQGYEPLYFMIRDREDNIVGVAPFFLCSIMGGLASIALSLPRSDVGGPLLDQGIDPSMIAKPLLDKLKKDSILNRILSYTVITADLDMCSRLLPDWKLQPHHRYVLNLRLEEDSIERIWNSNFTRDGRQRNNIRKMEKDGFSTHLASESELPEFFSLYEQTVRRAGGTPYPYSFIKDIWDLMHPRYFNILVSVGNGKIAGGSAFLCNPERKRLHLLFGAYTSNTGSRNTINLFTWWHNILWAKENGYDLIDLGTSSVDPKDSTYKFKKQFGPTVSRKYILKRRMIPSPIFNFSRRMLGINDLQ